MNEIERDTTSPAEWWLDLPEPKSDPDTYTVEKGRQAAADITEDLMSLDYTLTSADTALADAVQYLGDLHLVQDMVQIVAMIQDLKRKLSVAEAYTSRALGQLTNELGTGGQGQTHDGRKYEVMKGKDRKAWDHERWQRDVRLAALVDIHDQTVTKIVDKDSGELAEIALSDLLRTVQEVHGSTAPKVRALKALDLSADDYAETAPGPWSVKIQQES